LSGPRVDSHPSPRERPSTQDECGAAPDGDVCISQLPSAVESGRRSPTSVFTIDLVDFDTVTQNEPVLDRFLEESGHSDPALLRPPTEIVESDDNHDLDLDAGSVEGDADSLCSPLCLSSLVEDPHLTDRELLNACVNTIDPASSSPLALFQSSSHLYITLSCATVYSRIHGIPSLGFGEGVIAQEYNESWLVTSVISVDTCDCVHPWSAPW
jgi:hypothetical protein